MQTIACQCTLISDVHYHIIIPYVHFHSPVSPGSPSHGLTQPTSPWGYKLSLAQLRGAPAHSSALAGPKGTLLCPSHKAAGAGHDLYNTLYYSKSTKQGAKTIPPSANKAMCSEGWDTFLARIENHSHSWWQGMKKKNPDPGFICSPAEPCTRNGSLHHAVRCMWCMQTLPEKTEGCCCCPTQR